jgi:hypothetical protein
MPVELSTCLDLDLVVFDWSGDVTMAEWRVAFDRYLGDAHYRPGRTELHTSLHVRSLDATFKSIWSALSTVNGQAREHGVRTRTVLATPNDVIFGLARIYQTLAQNTDGIVVEIHRTEAEALAALGLGYGSVRDLRADESFVPHTPGVFVHAAT